MKTQLIIFGALFAFTLTNEAGDTPATTEKAAAGLQPTKEMTANIVAAQMLQEGTKLIEMVKMIDGGVPANPQQGSPAVDAKDIQTALGKENVDRFRVAREILETGNVAKESRNAGKKK